MLVFILQFLVLVLPLLLVLKLSFGTGLWVVLFTCALLVGRIQKGRALQGSVGPGSAFKVLPLRWWLVAHSLVVVGFCLHHIGGFMGWEVGGSPQVPRQQQRHIQYNGYYFNAQKAVFTAALPKDAPAPHTAAGEVLFGVSAFGDGERLELRPPSGGREGWRLFAFPFQQPLRLNGWVINPNSRWLQPDADGTGDRSFFAVGSIRISWLASASDKGNGQNLFRLEQRGGCGNGADSCSFEASLPPLREGQPLGDFVQRLIAKQEESGGNRDKRIVLREEELRAMEGSFLVRAFKGDDEQVSPDPFQKAPFKRAPDTLIVISNAPQPASLNATAPGAPARLQLGLEDEKWGIVLPTGPHAFTFAETPGARLWPLRFLNPPHWTLPGQDDYLPSAATQSEFILTSSRDYIPLPGYFLEGNGRRHEFYARASLTPDLKHWGFTDGKTKRWQVADAQIGRGKDRSAMPRLGDQVPLGDEVQGALVSLEPARAAVPYAGRQARNRVLLAFALYSLALCPLLVRERNPLASSEPRDAGVLDGAWHLLWSGALILVVFRVVLAYRVSLLPPLDAPVSQEQLSAVFADSLRQSLWVAFWVPAVIAIARFGAWWLECKEALGIGAQWQTRAAVGAFVVALLGALLLDVRGGVWPWPALFVVALVAVVTALTLRPGQRVGARRAKVTPSSSLADWEQNPRVRLSALGALFLVWPLLALFCLVLSRVRLLPSINLFALPLMAGVLLGCVYFLGRVKNGQSFWPETVSRRIAPLETPEENPSAQSVKDRAARKKRASGFLATCIWACIGGMVLGTLLLALVLDPGISLYLFAVAVAACGLLFLRDDTSRWMAAVAPLSAVVLVGLVLSLQSTRLATAVRVSLQDKPVGYRLAVLGNREQDVFLARSSGTTSEGARGRSLDPLTLIKNNSQQQWQMLHYVAQGRHNTPGYGQVPLNEQAMTYATAVSDCVFAVFIVGEHGMSTAMAVLGLYLLVGGACLWAMSAMRRNRRGRLAPLALVGGFFMGMALYMVAANIGMLVFTGQNLPLLSLRSSSDGMQGLLLLGLAAFLMNANLEADADKDQVERLVAWSGAAFWLVALACYGAIGLHLWRFERPQPYNLSQGVLDHLRQNQPLPQEEAGSSNAPIVWTRTEEKFVLRPQKAVSLLEQENVNAFNALSLQEQFSTAGLYHIRNGEVTSNLDAFRLSSPFNPTKNWTGAVLARGQQAPDPVLTALGRPFSISLSSGEEALPIILDFDARANAAQRGLGRIILRERGGDNLAQVSRNPKNGEVSISRGALRGYNLWVEGKSLGNAKTRAEQSRILNRFDLITIERRAGARRGAENKRFNLIFLGKQSPALAFCQWRNGKPQLLTQKSDVFPMSAAIIDTARQIASPKLKQINLSLDLPLHEQLQRDMDAWARTSPYYRNSRQDTVKSRQQRLALSVIDAFSGEVLALPSWPRVDPASPKYAEQASGPDQRRDLLRNHNLVVHAVGSTIKPLTFSTVAAGFWPHYDVSKLSVFATGHEGTFNKYQSFGNLRLDKPFTPPGNPVPLMTTSGVPSKIRNNFLVRSLNWPEVVLGGLGTLQNSSQLPLALRDAGGERPDLMWGEAGKQRPKRFNLAGIPNSAFTRPNTGQNPVIAPAQLETSLLFQGLNRFADARFSQDEDSVRSFKLKEARQQWPSLAPAVPVNPKNAVAAQRRLNMLDPIMLEDVNMDPTRLSSISRDLIPFLIGGGECRWNNVSMSEVAARLATGRRVEATFEARPPQKRPQWSALPAPIGDLPATANWRTQNLLRVLNGVSTLKEGTAHSYTNGKLGRYAGLFKSGTINEDDKSPRNSEMLLFVIGEIQGSFATKARFVPGRTVAGFLYMQKCNEKGANDLRKAQLFPRLMKDIVRYLDQTQKPN